MENSNMMLTKAMTVAGMRNGFDEIQAEFSAFRDFKLKWMRSYKWISFEVSDYLRNAPENVIQSLAETVFARIRGDDKTAYSQEVCDYLNSEGFLKENQNLFLKRFRGLTPTAQGENVDLMESYRRLVRSGLAEDDPRIVVRWDSTGGRRVGRSSVLMKTVVMSSGLDNSDISENALDYALYSQICHVNLGFGPTRENDAERYDAMLSKYPDRIKVEEELRELGFRL